MKITQKNTEQAVGGWSAPCEAIDYAKLAENARQQVELLRDRLHELNSSRLQRGETELARRRTVRILTDMYYEQKSYWKLFAQRAEQREQVLREAISPAQQKAGETKRRASSAGSSDYTGNAAGRKTACPAGFSFPAGPAARPVPPCGARTSSTL